MIDQHAQGHNGQAIGQVSPNSDDQPLENLETDRLLELITEKYDSKHMEQLPQLHRLARKIEVVHRDHPDAPHGLTRLIKRFENEFLEHLEREQKHAFAKMAGDQPPRPETPISQMNSEHDTLIELVIEIRKLTGEYRPPENACRSWRRLYGDLQKLDVSVTEQVHLERDILYPRFQF
jgi:regulator of cell morphogenesis and NO signaling